MIIVIVRISKRNITATLPILLLEKIDELVTDGQVSSRSRFIREAVKNYFKTPQ